MAEEQQPKEEKKESPVKAVLRTIAEFPSRNLEHPPSFLGQLDAMRREMLKDVNNTFHQVFFGQGVAHGEPGTPMVPTQAQVTQSLGNVHGYSAMLEDASVQHPPKSAERGQGLER